MLLFSVRYPRENFEEFDPFSENEKVISLISEKLRIRLTNEIDYIVTSGLVEKFLTVYDEGPDKFYFHKETLRDFTNRELGYDITEYYDSENHSYNYIDDIKLFDLVEILIIFCKETEKIQITERLNQIFIEFNEGYQIGNYMVIPIKRNGLKNIIPLLKDQILSDQLKQYFYSSTTNFKNLAQIAADILQYLYSSPKNKINTKKYSENICKELASKHTLTKNRDELFELINNEVNSAKDFNNQIQNIRHTDKFTIPIERPNLYKLIASKSMSIVELTILTSPEKYISTDSPEVLKRKYLEKYNLKVESGWIKKKPIEVDDIPF